MSVARIAPTLAVPTATALLRGAVAFAAPGAAAGAFGRAVEGLFPGATVTGFASGRAALAEALGVAMRASGRRRVVLPAFTSWSVAAAASRAGAAVDLCDLDPATWGLDRAHLRHLVGPDTAAVVLGNLFGTPDRIDDLAWLGDRGVVVIDDAAQALGARERGRPVGGRGGLGVLSFGRGKCVTLGDAGALLVFDPALARHVPAQARGSRGLKPLLMAAAMPVCVSPALFGLVSRLPGGGIGESHYQPDFSTAGAPASVDGMARDLPGAVSRHLAVRRRVAAWWDEVLAGAPGVSRPALNPGAEPAFLRVPFLAADARAREELVRRLGAANFPFVRSFPAPLGSIAEFRRICGPDIATPVADDIAARLVALPVHVGVSHAAIKRAAPIFHP